MAAVSTSRILAPSGRSSIMARRKSFASVLNYRLRHSSRSLLSAFSVLILLLVLALTPADYSPVLRAEGSVKAPSPPEGAEDVAAEDGGDAAPEDAAPEDAAPEDSKASMEELMAKVQSMGASPDLMDNLQGLADSATGGNIAEKDRVIVISDEEEERISVFDKITDEDKTEIEARKEKHQYQAEVTRLMDIIINSLYTQKEVFLRELISNSADALERIRFKAVDDVEQLGDTKDLVIKVEINKTDKILSIQDTGIGMTKHDLITNLGTVAKSGTSNFLEALSKGGDINLIGQFGVGFYSAFLVADKVTVYSKSNDDEHQYIWESSADGSFSITVDPRGNSLGRGTRLSLHIKEDATEFLNESKIKDLVTKYSQFISFPIYVKHEKTETVEEEIEDTDAEEEAKAKEEDADAEDAEAKDVEEEPKKKTKKVEKVTRQWKQVNIQKPLWLRPKEEITKEEYHAFYKSITKDYQDPLTYIHFTGEGEIEFKCILFIPAKAPVDMFDNYFNKQTTVKLYVRRVLVADQFDDILPKYLHFVKGVIDSDDLPLNVSREQLQQHKIMKVISKKLVRKVLELLKKLNKDSKEDMAKLKEELENEEDADAKKAIEKKISEGTKDDKLWSEFRRNIKLGCFEDDSNRSKLSKVLKFYTSKSPETPITLDKLLENIKDSENNSNIYYASGESVNSVMKLPQIQIFIKKGIEVLLLTEAMDEPCIQKLTEYEGKKFVSVQKGDISLDQSADEEKHQKKLKKLYKPLLDWTTEKLAKKVSKVDLSRRLVSDPVAVVSSSWGYSAYMEKIMKTQTFADNNQVKMMTGQKQLELNPTHPVVYDLLQKVTAHKDDPKALETLNLLFQTALVASGFDIDEPTDLSSRVYEMIGKELGVDVTDTVDVDVSEVEDDVEKEPEPEDDEGEDADEAADEGADAGADAEENNVEDAPVEDEGGDAAGTHEEL